MTMPETPETAPVERSPDDTTEGTRDLLFNEICELFRNPEREWTLADELIALLARLGLLNSQPVRDAELERLRKRHVESFDAAAWHLNKVTKDQLKWEQESLVQQRRAEQAEAVIERVRKRHRAMDIYFGDERCLEDAECYAEQDYPEDGGSATGGFCPHTLKAATICTACSQMDSKTESWPEDRWVLFENCKTRPALDTPTPAEEGSDV